MNQNRPPKPYQPVSCSLYDSLELAAIQKKKLRFEVDRDGSTDEIEAIPIDLFSSEGVEYVRLDNGETLRLDAVRVL